MLWCRNYSLITNKINTKWLRLNIYKSFILERKRLERLFFFLKTFKSYFYNDFCNFIFPWNSVAWSCLDEWKFFKKVNLVWLYTFTSSHYVNVILCHSFRAKYSIFLWLIKPLLVLSADVSIVAFKIAGMKYLCQILIFCKWLEVMCGFSDL